MTMSSGAGAGGAPAAPAVPENTLSPKHRHQRVSAFYVFFVLFLKFCVVPSEECGSPSVPRRQRPGSKHNRGNRVARRTSLNCSRLAARFDRHGCRVSRGGAQTIGEGDPPNGNGSPPTDRRLPEGPPVHGKPGDAKRRSVPSRLSSSFLQYRSGARMVHRNFVDIWWAVLKKSLKPTLRLLLFSVVLLVVSPTLGRSTMSASLILMFRARRRMQPFVNAEYLLLLGILFAAAVTLNAWLMLVCLPVGVALLAAHALGRRMELSEAVLDGILRGYAATKATYFYLIEGIESEAQMLTERRFPFRVDEDGAKRLLDSPLRSALRTILIGPFLDELLFRGILQAGIKRIVCGLRHVAGAGGGGSRGGGEASSSSSPEEGQSLSSQPVSGADSRLSSESSSGSEPASESDGRRTEPWVAVSSVLFAFASTVHWIDLLPAISFVEAAENVKDALRFVGFFLVVFHFFSTMELSLVLLSPTFERDGLAAAVGAHSMYSANATYFLLFRLGARFLRRVTSVLRKRIVLVTFLTICLMALGLIGNMEITF